MGIKRGIIGRQTFEVWQTETATYTPKVQHVGYEMVKRLDIGDFFREIDPDPCQMHMPIKKVELHGLMFRPYLFVVNVPEESLRYVLLNSIMPPSIPYYQ